MTATRLTTGFAKAAAGALALALLALPAPARGATGDVKIKEFRIAPTATASMQTGGIAATQAGAHPNLGISMRFCDPDTNPNPDIDTGCTVAQVGSHVAEFKLQLPAGLLANPTVVPAPCPTQLFLAASCPPESQIGSSLTILFAGGVLLGIPTQLFVVQTLGLEPARLGTSAVPFTRGVLPIYVSVDTANDYSIDSTLKDIPTGANLIEIDTTLFGSVGGKPFVVNPTSCKPISAALDAHSHETPENIDQAFSDTHTHRDGSGNPITEFLGPSYQTTGCGATPFSPNVTVQPDTTQAGASTGYSVAIQYPQYANAKIWQASLRNADITLPDGVSLAPAGGTGLEACTAEQFGVTLGPGPEPVARNNDPVKCPEGSQIGDVTVTTPVLPTPLQGKAFFGPTNGVGRPTPDRPWKLFLLLEGQGLRIKLVGDVSVGTNGQIRTRFVNQPEVPFTRFELHTKGGDNAPLSNPTTCTTHTGSAVLDGYNGKTVTIAPTVTPTGCPDPRPFQPVLEDASAVPTQAGASSTSHLLFTVPDGQQQLKTLKLSLPPGAVGSLAAVPLCPTAVVNALGSDPTANCPDSSKVGTIKTTVGTGTALLTVAGSVYIGEPIVAGDAASFVIVVPAKVGPIDLGRVPIVNRALLRASDSGVDVLSPDIPNILEGVPLPVRRIEITIDREGFFLNPTGCDTRVFVASFTSYEGGAASASFPTAATGCDKLPFSPKLRLIAGAEGFTKKDSHPPLKAIVAQGPGESNISQAKVTLPDIIRPNVPQFQKPGALCSDVQLATRTCPASSQVGTALVRTPVLPFPLLGPVYIVLKSGQPLPELAVFLRNHGIEVLLRAGNGFSGIRILNTFSGIPDVPQSYFELNIKGGSNGILNAFSDLCETRPLPIINATFIGHSGKRVSSTPRLETDGCAGAGGARIVSKSVRMSRKGVVKIRVRCKKGTPASRCKGRLSLRLSRALERKSFAIKRGKAKTVKVKFSRKGRKAVRRAKRLRAKATIKLNGPSTLSTSARSSKKTITVKAPRKRH